MPLNKETNQPTNLNLQNSRQNKESTYSGGLKSNHLQTITDADDIALLANTPAQAKCLLHSLDEAAGGIGFHVKADKTVF